MSHASSSRELGSCNRSRGAMVSELTGPCGSLGIAGRIAGNCGPPWRLSPSTSARIVGGARTAERLQHRERRHLRPRRGYRQQLLDYNRIGANLTGLLVVALALGLGEEGAPRRVRANRCGRAASSRRRRGGRRLLPPRLPRKSAHRLYRQAWAFYAHKIESGITGAATIAAPLILALAFRRIPAWRDSWLRASSRCQCDPPGQCRLLGSRERGGHASGNGRRLPLDRLHQRAPASGTGPLQR